VVKDQLGRRKGTEGKRRMDIGLEIIEGRGGRRMR
jgi:hypothetical protein